MIIKSFLALGMIFCLILHPFSSYAQLPVDPSIAHGHAVINTVNSHMTIINTPNTILDWQSFSIGVDNSVYFQQQNADSMILNRVTGSDPSHLLGSLGSNGHIWLINPYGVLFGEHARIDAAGLVASTMGIANVDFLAKNYSFNSVGIPGEIKNQGEIRTSFGGHVWLMGNRVQNEGLIQTPGGHTAIAAGKSVEFIDSGAPNVIVRVKAPENEIVNLGSLVAQNGQVDLHSSIVNQQGIIRANSVNADEAGRIVLKADQVMFTENSQTQADQGTVQMEVGSTLNNWGAISGKDIKLEANEILQQGQVIAQGGNITLFAKTSTYLDGIVDVSNVQGMGGNILLVTNKMEGMASGSLLAGGEQGGNIRVEGSGSIAFSSTLAATGNTQGGKIEVTGDRVYLLNADVDASSSVQGGTVHLGGKENLPQARELLIGVGSEIKADGGTGADAKGGEITVWSTQSSEHFGLLQAKEGHIQLASLEAVKKVGDIQTGVGGTQSFESKSLTLAGDRPDNITLVHRIISGSVNGKPSLTNGDDFGTSVALQGDLLAVGSPGASSNGINNHGSVQLFTGIETDGLTWQKELSSGQLGSNMPVLADSDAFGIALALDGDHLAVGARGAILGEGNHGSVHLFSGVGSNFSGITWKKEIISGFGAFNMPSLTEFDFFGTAVALDGDRLVVGAAGDSTGARINSGAVHYFTGVGDDFSRLSWEGKLESGTKGLQLANSDFFGWSVALDGDRLAVGAFNDSTEGSSRGAVHLFTGVGNDFSGLAWRGKLASGVDGVPSLANSDFFGWSVALHGDRMAIGALGNGSGDSNRGAVYLLNVANADFSKPIWLNKLIPNVNSNTDGFGSSVALDTDRLAVGAIESSGGSGAMYVFNVFPESLADLPNKKQETTDTSIQSINAAVSSARGYLDASTGRVADMSSGTSTTANFGRILLKDMNLLDMQQIIDERKVFKRNLFSEAIHQLEMDPNLSNVPVCASIAEIDSGKCRISAEQHKKIADEKKEQLLSVRSTFKTKVAVLPQIERKFVILFGIDHYADKTIPSLENTISDAEAVGQLFGDKLGYDVHVIKNATRADIIRTLNQLSTTVKVNDSVVIYYAGHGYMNEKSGNGYWIPSDASSKDPSTWISNTSISEMLANIQSKQMVMISDSCYSGAFAKEKVLGVSSLNAKPDDILTKRSVVVMSSGGDEPVADEGRGGHSIFAWFLMQALRDVDQWKIGTNIFERVQQDVERAFPQKPQYGAAISAGHQMGADYLFEKRELE